MQQPAAVEVELLTQVQIQLADKRLGRQLQPALLRGDVAGQRYRRGVRRYPTQPLSDDHLAVDHFQP